LDPSAGSAGSRCDGLIMTRENYGECYLCLYPRQIERHHVDGEHENNLPSNVVHLCFDCHRRVTSERITREELDRIRGMVQDRMSRGEHPRGLAAGSAASDPAVRGLPLFESEALSPAPAPPEAPELPHPESRSWTDPRDGSEWLVQLKQRVPHVSGMNKAPWLMFSNASTTRRVSYHGRRRLADIPDAILRRLFDGAC